MERKREVAEGGDGREETGRRESERGGTRLDHELDDGPKTVQL